MTDKISEAFFEIGWWKKASPFSSNGEWKVSDESILATYQAVADEGMIGYDASAEAESKRGNSPLTGIAQSKDWDDKLNNRLDIKALLSTLSEEDKSFVSMKLDGHSEQEIAAAFGQNPKWADNKWQYLQKKFRFLSDSGE